MSEPAITVRGLKKSYGSNQAVRGIDLEVQTGEVFGFLGPNGAGKTTTIEILEGYRKRTGGDVSVLDVDPDKPTRAWRDRIGLVLQECQLEPLLTVRETVGLFSSFYTHPRSVDDTVELVGLSEKREARVGTLSGGQRRRVDVAVGIIGDPELVFLDEPTTGFDPSARRDAWNMIEGLKDLGKTIFLTTHYMEEAQHLADRVAILRDGEIVAGGQPDELGAAGGRATVIRFPLPDGTSADALRGLVSDQLDVSGNRVSLHTEHPQRALYKITGWASRGGLSWRGWRRAARRSRTSSSKSPASPRRARARERPAQALPRHADARLDLHRRAGPEGDPDGRPDDHRAALDRPLRLRCEDSGPDAARVRYLHRARHGDHVHAGDRAHGDHHHGRFGRGRRALHRGDPVVRLRRLHPGRHPAQLDRGHRPGLPARASRRGAPDLLRRGRLGDRALGRQRRRAGRLGIGGLIVSARAFKWEPRGAGQG